MNCWTLPLLRYHLSRFTLPYVHCCSDRFPLVFRIRQRRTRESAAWSTFLPRLSLPSSHALLQEDRLMISDPKAMQYIYQTASYSFNKPSGRRSITRALVGPGLSTVEGQLYRARRSQ